MAGRPRKTVAENAVEKNIEEDATVKKENNDTNVNANMEMDLLKKENEELKSQLQLILSKLSESENNKKDVAPVDEMGNVDNTYFTDSDSESSFKDINPLKPIKVVSLSDGGVSLKTSTNGSGKIFRFDKFGHSITITYSDLQDVIATNRSFIEDGSVYICDADVVKNNYLDEFYNKFLTPEKITNILSFSKEAIADMVRNATPTIQETIISLVVKKINNNEYVDMNKVEVIGKSCATPCDIPALALQKRVR